MAKRTIVRRLGLYRRLLAVWFVNLMNFLPFLYTDCQQQSPSSEAFFIISSSWGVAEGSEGLSLTFIMQPIPWAYLT
jgi:hypothetical protein